MTDKESLERLRNSLIALVPDDGTYTDDVERLNKALANAWAKGFHLGANYISGSARAAETKPTLSDVKGR